MNFLRKLRPTAKPSTEPVEHTHRANEDAASYEADIVPVIEEGKPYKESDALDSGRCGSGGIPYKQAPHEEEVHGEELHERPDIPDRTDYATEGGSYEDSGMSENPSDVPEREDLGEHDSEAMERLRDFIQDFAVGHALPRESITWYFNPNIQQGSIRIRTQWPPTRYITDIELAVLETTDKDQACNKLHDMLKSWVLWLADLQEILRRFMMGHREYNNHRAKMSILGTDNVEFGFGVTPYRYGETEFAFSTCPGDKEAILEDLQQIAKKQWPKMDEEAFNSNRDDKGNITSKIEDHNQVSAGHSVSITEKDAHSGQVSY